jgi:hypothetical protein
MASNFAFGAFGLSQRVTVVATAGTVSMSVIRSGGTTLAVSAGNYAPSGVRVSNNSPITVFLQFGDSTVTVGVNTGMEILPNSVETFKTVGMPFFAHICSGTATIGVTPGEGL